MFEEEYKKKYDSVHPSAELIEKTKKRALEAYKKQSEEIALEDCDMWDEENSKISRNKKWIRIVGGMAAGIAIVATGVYLGNSLQPKSQKESHVAKSVETPEVTVCAEETAKPKKENKKETKKNQVERKESLEINASSNVINKIAQMGRGQITIDYASESRVIFHGDFGIMIYSISEQRVLETIATSQYDEKGTGVRIKVNTEGTKILFYTYNEETLTDDVALYEIGSGHTESIDPEDSVSEGEMFGLVQSVAGTDADVYTSRTGEMVALGNNKYIQLMYQVPASSMQASLSVSIIDLNAKTEHLYSIFGSLGKSIEEKQGRTYGNYHNEHGIALFEKTTEDEIENSEAPEIVETTEVAETLFPEQTVVPEVTTAVEKETMAPLVEETELPAES